MLRQYQELTGPVLVPAAGFDPALLSWIPRATQPDRRLAPRRIGDYARPEFQALYRPEGLEWEPSARQIARALLPRRLGDCARHELAELYRPEGLEWVPVDKHPSSVDLPRRLGDFTRPVQEAVVPPTAPTPSGQSEIFDLLQYQEVTGPVFVPAAAPPFDPSGLQWQTSGTAPARGLQPRRLGSFARPDMGAAVPPAAPTASGETDLYEVAQYQEITGPIFVPAAAGFDPSGLQWRAIDAYAGRRAPVARITHSVGSPFPVAPAAPFDPAGLQWIPRDRYSGRALRVLRGELVQPSRAALYDPSRIEWLSSGRYPGRALQRYRVTYEVGDPLPRPRAPTPVAPVEDVTPGPIQQSLRPTLRLRPSAQRPRLRRLREPKKLRRYRREIRLLTERTEALAAALTYAEQQQNEAALEAAMRMAEAVQIELTAYLERRRMMQVIAITLLLLEDACCL